MRTIEHSYKRLFDIMQFHSYFCACSYLLGKFFLQAKPMMPRDVAQEDEIIDAESKGGAFGVRDKNDQRNDGGENIKVGL